MRLSIGSTGKTKWRYDLLAENLVVIMVLRALTLDFDKCITEEAICVRSEVLLMSAKRHETFEGWYYKHQTGGHTLAVIPGRSKDGAFIQMVTESGSYNESYDLRDYRREGGRLWIGGNEFSSERMRLDMPNIKGELRYGSVTPIRGDIMGPFRFFPMECRHGIVSMKHTVSGSLVVNGETVCFDGGSGYIETDSGRSFPDAYTWVQCNDFQRNCSIMASAALIPFAGLRFWGCIAVIWIDGREYRLATYHGAKIACRESNRLILKQGGFSLEVETDCAAGRELYAPRQGAMSRTIYECAACPAHFRFTLGKTPLFAGEGLAGYEYAAAD